MARPILIAFTIVCSLPLLAQDADSQLRSELQTYTRNGSKPSILEMAPLWIRWRWITLSW